MEAAVATEALVAFYHIRRRHIPEDSNHNIYSRDSVKSNSNEPSGIFVRNRETAKLLLNLVQGRTVSG
jgi:hypothetical protein